MVVVKVVNRIWLKKLEGHCAENEKENVKKTKFEKKFLLSKPT